MPSPRRFALRQQAQLRPTPRARYVRNNQHKSNRFLMCVLGASDCTCTGMGKTAIGVLVVTHNAPGLPDVSSACRYTRAELARILVSRWIFMPSRTAAGLALWRAECIRWSVRPVGYRPNRYSLRSERFVGPSNIDRRSTRVDLWKPDPEQCQATHAATIGRSPACGGCGNAL